MRSKLSQSQGSFPAWTEMFEGSFTLFAAAD
jgi:hypothetical protein